MLWLLSSVVAPAATAPTNLPAWVADQYRADQERFDGEAEVLVRPGLRADRRTGVVTVCAAYRNPQYPVEYFMVWDRSGRDYEALLLSHAAPGDVHEGLAFIGMQPGRPVDYDTLRFWPKGERVRLRVAPVDGDPEADGMLCEDLVVDLRTGKTLPREGFVFVGSQWITSPLHPGRTVYAADAEEPHSLASNYNEPWTVLDIPRRLAKGEAYDVFIPADREELSDGDRVFVYLSPEERPGGAPRVADVTLHARPADGAVALSLRAADGKALAADKGWIGVLAAFGRLTERQRDPFVQLDFDETLTLRQVAGLCEKIETIEADGGIRVEPPPVGEPYYGAFLPEESFREREERVSQPWELHLGMDSDTGAATGMLYRLEQEWQDRDLEAMIKEEGFPVTQPDAAAALLQEHGPGLPVVVLYAPDAMTYGQLLEIVTPILPTHPTVYVYRRAE